MVDSNGKRLGLVLWLSAILIAGFLATTLAGYVVSRDAIRRGISAQELPLTGDNVYSEIQKDILRPVFISSVMAHDTFVRDWIIGGEKDPDSIRRYLREYQDKYGMVTAFFVSEQTRIYYHPDGILKKVREDQARDAWYFRVRQLTQPFETNVDPDMANRDTMTVFINYRVVDYQGKFIGAIGVGLTIDTIRKILDSYQERFQRRIYFVDRGGHIVLAGKTQGLRGSIREHPGIRQVADAILSGDAKPRQLAFEHAGSSIQVNARFIPELNWHLLVEQNEQAALSPVRQILAVNLALSAIVTGLVLATILLTIRRYQSRLERLATTDQLTGLVNRHTVELLFEQALKQANRHHEPLSVILFDLDHFKAINDTYGHLAGDFVLRRVAELARTCVRDSDVIGRWGGEEFLVVLRHCSAVQALEIAEKLRLSLGRQSLQYGDSALQIHLSAGVAQWRVGESAASFFARIDTALYQAKDQGRDRVVSNG